MHGFIKRNQKKILAIFSAGLMVAFMLPAAVKNNKTNSVVVGTAGKTKISNVDVQEAREQWKLLHQTLFVKQRADANSEEVNEVPFLNIYFQRRFMDLGPQMAQQAAAQTIQTFDQNPELFYLLVREAKAMGASASLDELRTIVTNASAHPDDGPNYEQRAEEAIRSLLMVSDASERGATIAKVSRPLRDNALMRDQEIGLNLVEFKAADYLSKLPEWTPQEKTQKVNDQYEKYKDQEPTTRPTNEFGFGYKVPNQVRVQSIELHREAIRKQVSSKISDVDARKFYYQNIAQYPPVFGVPAGSDSDTNIPKYLIEIHPLPSGPPVLPSATPTSAPSKKYFVQHREEIVKRLADEGTQKLTRDILAAINNEMNADYAAYKRALGDSATTAGTTTMPTTAQAKAPSTPLGAPYWSYEYMQKLAQKIQQDFGVLPSTEGTGLRTAKQLAESSNLGKSTHEGYDLLSLIRRGYSYAQIQESSTPAQFPFYISTFVDAFANDQARQFAAARRLRVLSLYEPSPLFVDMSGEQMFIFRVSEAVPAHAPLKDDVITQLVADARLQDAYKLAQEDARKLLDSLTATQKANPSAHLQQAAAAAGKPLITTGLFSPQQPDIMNYKTPAGEATNIFINGAYALLNQTASTQQHPVGVLDFKPSATVIVGELNEIKPRWTPETLASHQLSTTAIEDRMAARKLRVSWFSYADIVARTHYKPAEPSRNQPKHQDPAPPPIGA